MSLRYGVAYTCDFCPATATVWAPPGTGTTPSAYRNTPEDWHIVKVRGHYPAFLRACPDCLTIAKDFALEMVKWRQERNEYAGPIFRAADASMRTWELEHPRPKPKSKESQ